MHTSYDHHDQPPPRRTDTTDLSPREGQILRMIAAGNTDTKIGGDLGISTDTIETHVRGLFRKLDARNRANAVDIAWRRGLLGDGGER